jgi:hypothetical protein
MTPLDQRLQVGLASFDGECRVGGTSHVCRVRRAASPTEQHRREVDAQLVDETLFERLTGDVAVPMITTSPCVAADRVARGPDLRPRSACLSVQGAPAVRPRATRRRQRSRQTVPAHRTRLAASCCARRSPRW